MEDLLAKVARRANPMLAAADDADDDGDDDGSDAEVAEVAARSGRSGRFTPSPEPEAEAAPTPPKVHFGSTRRPSISVAPKAVTGDSKLYPGGSFRRKGGR